MGDEGGGVDLAAGYQTEYLGAVARVDASGLEGEVFPVHVGEREYLGLVVEGDDGYDGVGPGAFPG